MVLKKPIRVDTDVKIAGAVTWVGRSSMEIQLEVTQSTEGTCNVVISFLCSFPLILLELASICLHHLNSIPNYIMKSFRISSFVDTVVSRLSLYR